MKQYKQLANKLRKEMITIVSKVNGSHIGGCLSIIDILVVLYDNINIKKDKVILSKGHNSLALYSILSHHKLINKKDYFNYCQDGSCLGGHIDIIKNKYLGASTGSLGHGLPIGTGMALANKLNKNKNMIYVILGEGECNEGSIWEAARLIKQFDLNNIKIIIDCNGLQGISKSEEMMPYYRLKNIWKANGFNVVEIEGHNYEQIELSLKDKNYNVIIAKTIKGKGVSFMEDKLEWHYKAPNREELKRALDEL